MSMPDLRKLVLSALSAAKRVAMLSYSDRSRSIAFQRPTALPPLLLTGPPGTGKTAFAHHLARAFDRPLLVKRASDLLSRWVGETQAQIADAFAEARRREAVLLFDEADSLLLDRSTARTSWDVGQVNELLTWLDLHPLPVIAATNHEAALDPATLRRFVFKLRLKPLGTERTIAAFQRFFGEPAPACVRTVEGLTPGDFAVVARQLRHWARRRRDGPRGAIEGRGGSAARHVGPTGLIIDREAWPPPAATDFSECKSFSATAMCYPHQRASDDLASKHAHRWLKCWRDGLAAPAISLLEPMAGP